ncbi:MAG: SAM-dependent methyltransferase [Ornithinimicrobium sp.]|uniref:SAM-dependent methyltransferase n=1 Tax=Ornithinimicrobium sp. TaxID=1977084 RepID=UPI0017C176B9|nr:SAM-dependent methyltransferase [Actinomycetota bacterium]
MVQDDALPWDRAWQQALYGKTGFYRRPEGPGGHFATSAQGIPQGTEMLAQVVVGLARRHGLQHVVDVGAGRGELAAEVARQEPHLRVTAVDVVPRPGSLPAEVAWQVSPGGSALPAGLAGLTGSLVLAHEWLDVVPCPVVQRDQHGVWRVVAVGRSGNERLTHEPDEEQQHWLHRWSTDHVLRAEIGTPRDRAWTDLCSRVDQGLVVAVDYGHTAGGRPTEGTLTAYRQGRQVRPVPDGSCDLTAHVAVDSLAAGTPGSRLRRQGDLLDDVLGPADAVPHGLARTEPTAYLHRLAQQAARRVLSAPGGLGDFWWVQLPRGATVGP